MIRFVDLRESYWAWDASDPTPRPPICAFIDTCTNEFIPDAFGDLIWHGPDYGVHLGERLRGLTPAGFWDERTK